MQISEIHKYWIRTPSLQLPIIGLPQIVVPPQIITTVATLNNHNHDNQNATKHKYRFKSGKIVELVGDQVNVNTAMAMDILYISLVSKIVRHV